MIGIVCKCKYFGVKMEVSVPSGSVCCFCLTTYEDEALYGKFYKIEEITTHYFCLLLSSKVQQRGSDNEGILGFLPLDIRNEVKRGKKLTCIYCGKRGATLSCHYSKCRSHFHLPCGRSRDTFHEFFGEFKSFCCRHRKTQRIKGDVLKAMSGKQSTCSICLESVPATPSPSTLWAPCCSKDAWFHRICIQRLALSAGYFFKCPLCNNTTRFIESMRTHGIWIPEQDAAWERDPERYEGLLQRHNSCDAKSCHCRNGRTHHVADTKWEIKLCAHCGSQGMHVQCGNLRLSEDWICSVCSNVSVTKDVQKTGKISHSREAHLARNRDRRSLPLRPPQRVTRQRRPPEEEIEEREEERGKEPHSVHSKSEISASKTDKGASSTPQKDDPSQVITRSSEVSPAGRQPSPEEENSDVEILENSDDEIQDRGATKNGPLLCNCKWSRSTQPPSPVICSYCCDWAREYIHIGKSSSATSIKNPQNLLSRFLQSLTGMPGPSLGKGEPLCQLWVIHYHSRKGSRASESRNSSGASQSRSSNRASQSRSPNRASRSRSPNQASRSRSVNRATRSKSPKCASQSSSNQVSDTSVSKVLSTLFEKPRTRSQSRSSGCHKPVSEYSKSPQISSQVRLSTCEVSSDKQSSDCESRFHYYELKTRRHTYRNQKDSTVKRKRSTSPGTSNNKRRGKSLQTNKSSQVSPSRKSPRKRNLSQSADSSSNKKGKLLAQNAPSLALAKLASFQPVVLLTRYNVRRREHSVERDNHRRSCHTGRSRRDQFTMQKKLQLEANDKAHKLWKDENVSSQSRNERKRTRSISRTFKNFQERSPVRTRSRSRSLGEDIQTSSHCHENVNGSNNKKKKSVKELIVIPGGRPFASNYETVSSSDETDVEIEVGEDALNETLASISEYCKIDSEGSDEIEDVVEVGEDSLNDTLASISGLGSITYDEDCSSYVIAPSSSSSGSFSNISSNCEDNCSVISISTSVKSSSSSSSSSSVVTNPSPLSSSQSSCISPHPPPTPSPQPSTSFPQCSPQPPSTPSPQCSPQQPSTPSPQCSPHLPSTPSPQCSPHLPSTPSPQCSPQPPSTPSPQCSPTSSPPSCLTVSCVSPLSLFASPAIFSSPSNEPKNTSGSVIKPSELKNQLPKRISNISSSLVRSPLPCSIVAESTESPSPATNVPLRRSSRRFCAPHDSILPSTSRASRRMHSDMCSEMPIRGSSPPPIFPNRSGSLTELECRIKARALTARKFVPFSPAARQQRAMMRQLQGRR